MVSLLIGVAASLALTRLLRSSLRGISPWEPRVFVATIVVLLLMAATPCLVSAWRAMRADPADALR